MANQISITRNAGDQHHAAKALSSALNELQINHVIIGGFALHLLGMPRHTDDVDMMIDVVPNEIHDSLRPRLKCINQHFAELGIKFYHVPTLVEGLADKELVLINKGNVLMETLPTNTLGLPSEINPAMILYLGEGEGSSGELNVLIFPKTQKILIIEI